MSFLFGMFAGVIVMLIFYDNKEPQINAAHVNDYCVRDADGMVIKEDITLDEASVLVRKNHKKGAWIDCK